MRFEPVKRVNGCTCPLPDVANDIVKIAMFELVDRNSATATDKPSLGRCFLRNFTDVVNSGPFIFGWQTIRLPRLCSFPGTEGRRFVIVDFNWSMPGHIDLAAHQAKCPTRFVLAPEGRVLGGGIRAPIPPLFCPI